MSLYEWDAFICHATEDKDGFVRPLAEALRAKRLGVWYDEFELKVGDSLRESIDRGLARSRYGVVVLSPNFFAKRWPQKELDGLMAKEREGQKVILPIWHDVTDKEVGQFSPILAGRLAASTSEGLDIVVQKLIDAMRPAKAKVRGSMASPANLLEEFPEPDDKFSFALPQTEIRRTPRIRVILRCDGCGAQYANEYDTQPEVVGSKAAFESYIRVNRIPVQCRSLHCRFFGRSEPMQAIAGEVLN